MKKLLALSIIAILIVGGCDSSKHPSRELVIVPDVSASIDPSAERQMFAAIEEVAQHLHRGDTLIIIPITGDAEAELQGRTLRYVVPPVENRQAYDADLRKLNVQIKYDLAQLQVNAIAHPGQRSDIAGSIRVATGELSNGMADKWLIVLSDFIQEDKRLNFRTDPRLSTLRVANHLSQITAGKATLPLPNHILLGRLRSAEYSSLSHERQQAINEYWRSSLSNTNIDPDGTLMLIKLSNTLRSME